MQYLRHPVDRNGNAVSSVNTTVFNPRLSTFGERQYLAYYGRVTDNDNGTLRVAARDLPGGDWDVNDTGIALEVADAHYAPALGIGPDGHVFVSYNTRNSAIRWRRSETPESVSAFGPERVGMTGEDEASACYPEFTRTPEGEFLFGYREGSSGNGDWLLNRWDADGETWRPLQRPLTDGEDQRNAYHWNLVASGDGGLHYFFCWRETPDVATNSRLCYARSHDGGESWERGDGTPYDLPITRATSEVIDDVGRENDFLNDGWASYDPRTNDPHVTYLRNDPDGETQIHHVYRRDSAWHREAVTERATSMGVGGGGSRLHDIGRPAIAVAEDGTVYVVTRDTEHGGWPWVFEKRDGTWRSTMLYGRNLVWSEVHYDRERWRSDGVFSFVDQATTVNHRTDAEEWFAGGGTPVSVTDVDPEAGIESSGTDADDVVPFRTAEIVSEPVSVTGETWTAVGTGVPFTEFSFPATPALYRLTGKLRADADEGIAHVRAGLRDVAGEQTGGSEWTTGRVRGPSPRLCVTDWQRVPADAAAGEVFAQARAGDDAATARIDSLALELAYPDPRPELLP